MTTDLKFSKRSLLNHALGFKDAIPLGRDDIEEIFVKSQGRQFSMTPEKAAKIRQLLASNPEGGVTLSINALTGQVEHIQGAK